MFNFIFLRLSPVFKYRITGNSMVPTFSSNDIVLVNRLSYVFKKPQVGDIIAGRDPRDGKTVIKRITKIENTSYFIEGDNKNSSTDSRVFGIIRQSDIIGKVIT